MSNLVMHKKNKKGIMLKQLLLLIVLLTTVPNIQLFGQCKVINALPEVLFFDPGEVDKEINLLIEGNSCNVSFLSVPWITSTYDVSNQKMTITCASYTSSNPQHRNGVIEILVGGVHQHSLVVAQAPSNILGYFPGFFASESSLTGTLPYMNEVLVKAGTSINVISVAGAFGAGQNGAAQYKWRYEAIDGTVINHTTTTPSWINVPPITCKTTISRIVVFSNGVQMLGFNTLTVDILKPVNANANENYIVQFSPQTEMTSIEDESVFDNFITVQYADGLGRVKQSINVGASPDYMDVITPMVYDEFGRVSTNLLPYVYNQRDNRGSNRENPLMTNYQNSEHFDFHNSRNIATIDKEYAFSKTVFDDSPLNRVKAQGAPGHDWQPTFDSNGNLSGHTQKIEYGTNKANSSEGVLNFKVGNNALVKDGLVGANQLYKTITKTENWTSAKGKLNTTEEFTNKRGELILIRTYVGNAGSETIVDTYYVYDDHGRLRYVLSPEASKLIARNSTIVNYADNNATVILPWCYYYKYDKRGRMIIKKIPGANEKLFVYDRRDRLVLTQDGVQRNSNKWLMTKYDKENRPIMTAFLTTTRSHSQLQNDFMTYTGQSYESKSSGLVRYTFNDSKPLQLPNIYETNLLTVTYYDTYDFLSSSDFNNLQFSEQKCINTYSDNDGNTGYFDDVKGMVTATMTKALDDLEETGDATWLRSVNYYDNKYRVIQSARQLFPYPTDFEEVISNIYDFVGKVKQTRVDQNFGGIIKKVLLTNSYDHAGRLTEITHSLDNATPVSIAKMSYNELGELTQKIHHSDKQYVDYTYNIRGWLKSINNPSNASSLDRQFAMRLHYNIKPSNLIVNEQYNGNVAAMEWRNMDQANASISGKLEGYGYTYDALNRLSYADYASATNVTSSILVNTNHFDASIGNYDLNGNIQSLTRNYNGSMMDRLIYAYGGSNQLQSVIDNENDNLGFINGQFESQIEYTYDGNGNLESDKNRNITNIKYNYLNLPSEIYSSYLNLGQSGSGEDFVAHLYDAKGRKIAKKYNDQLKFYVGDFVYAINEDGDFYLDYIKHPEGMVQYTGITSDTYEYQYYLKDHLGNTRVVIDQNGSRKQQSAYFPFGMAFNKVGSSDNAYLYNGKELINDQLAGKSLGWYDYGARMYDPASGRWNASDNDAENYYRHSPYTYAMNNPIRFIDPDGNNGWDIVKGAYAAVIDNAGLGFTGAREIIKYNDGDDYNTGQDIGDAISMVIGGLQTIQGLTVAGGGAVVTAGSGGTASPVSVPVTVAGSGVAAHGTAMTFKAFQSLMAQEGRVDENKKVKPGDRGSYSDLKNQKSKYGQTEPVEMHEMPSFAAKKEAFKKKYGRYPNTADEIKMVRDQGVSEATKPNVHRQTRTYGGRNTKKQVQHDASDLNKAKELDEADLLKLKNGD
jgi:RHS repeat-associated protein